MPRRSLPTHAASGGLAPLVCVLVGWLALPATTSAQLKDDKEPKAVVETLEHDFGEVARSEQVTKTFEIANEGDGPLQVRLVQPGPFLEVIGLDREIAAGEKGKVEIRLDTEQIDGFYEGRVAVHVNDPELPTITFVLKVDSKTHILADPVSVRYVVPRFFDGHGIVELRLWAQEPKEMEVLRVESPYPFIETGFGELPEERRIPDHDGPQWLVQTRLRPDAPVGPLQGHLRIYVDHEKQKRVSIPLSGFVRPLFAVTPHERDFGDLEVGDTGQRAVLHVKYFGEGAVSLGAVASDVEGLDLAIEPIEDGREYYVHLLFPADMPKGDFAGHVTIPTSNEKEPELRVPIRGTIL